jgi:hypothetical protein
VSYDTKGRRKGVITQSIKERGRSTSIAQHGPRRVGTDEFEENPHNKIK